MAHGGNEPLLSSHGCGLGVVQGAELHSSLREFSGQERVLTLCCFEVLQHKCIIVSGQGSWLLSTGFLLPLLPVGMSGGCVSNPRCEVKNKTAQ